MITTISKAKAVKAKGVSDARAITSALMRAA
jgi:hypothetical protein